jgi:hypothetical protein
MIKVPGTEMELGGEKRVLAPLNAAAVKQYRDQIKAIFVGQLPDIELVSTLACASLQRNYPELTPAQVDELIDYGNLFDVWETLLNLSGLAVSAGKMVRRVQAEMDQAASSTT